MLAFHTALSGMAAQAKRMSVSAGNVANLRSEGVDPNAAPGAGGGSAEAFVPHKVVQHSVAGGACAPRLCRYRRPRSRSSLPTTRGPAKMA